MRIVYLHQHFRSPQMSGGTRSYEMARRWAVAGHDVQMIAARTDLPSDHKGWHLERMAGFDLHGLNIPYSNQMSYQRRIKAFFDFAIAAGIKAKSVGGDIVFATSTPLTIALPGVYASKRLGVPMVFEVRDLWPEMPIAIGAVKNPMIIWAARRLEKFAYRNSQHIVALSSGMADGVVKAGYPRENITIAPNSCDLDFFDQTSAAGERFLATNEHLRGRKIVAYTGAFGKINNVGYLVDMAAAMKKLSNDVVFVIAGDGQEYEKVKAAASDQAVLNDNFFLIGRVNKVDIPPILSAASVATSTCTDLRELRANSANKFFDGLASAKPMLINYEGWQADLIREHQCGIVVSATDANTAAKLLFEFLSDEERLSKAGVASLSLAKSMFDRDLIASRVLSAIEKAAAENP